MRAVVWSGFAIALAWGFPPFVRAQSEPGTEQPAPAAQQPASATASAGAEASAAPAEAAADAQAEAPRGEALGEEIVVTAQKREDRLLSVPISVSVVSAEALRASGAKNLSELQGLKPGVYFSGNSSYGGAPMAIRGTAGSNTALLDDPVAVYLDGVYLPSGAFSTSTLLDVAGIEVARGPQGTLQGRNATAGAVLVRSTDPKFAFGGYGRASIATPLEYRLEAAASVPLAETLAARASFGYSKEDGWADNVFNGEKLASSESLLGRLVLLFQPSEPLRLRLATSYSLLKAAPALARWAKTDFNPDPAGPLVFAAMSPPVPFQATPTVPLDAADRERIEDGKFSLNRPTDSRTIVFFNALEASYAFSDFADVVSVTGLVLSDTVGNNDSDGFAQAFPGDDREGFNRGDFDSQTVSEELRLQSNDDGRLSWILGGYYSFSHQDMLFRIYNLALTLGPPVLPPENRRYTAHVADQDDTTYAGFADATFHIIDMLAVTGGVRYTYEKKKFVYTNYARTFPDDAPIMTPAVVSPDSPKSWNDVSYRGKLVFTPIEPLMVYASFSKGFKSGGYNAFGVDPAFNPEHLWSWELGLKAELPQRRGWFAASAFTNKYDGLQIRSGVNAGGVIIKNAADSTIRGFEAEGQVKVVGGLSVQANVAYTDAHFDEFKDARDLNNALVDVTGNVLPRTPRWQYFLLGAYDLPVSDSWALRGEVSWRWRDRIYFYHTDQNSSALRGKPVGELGARLSAFYDPFDVSVALFATNLTDARSVNGFNPNFGYPEVSFNKPRVIGVEVEKKF